MVSRLPRPARRCRAARWADRVRRHDARRAARARAGGAGARARSPLARSARSRRGARPAVVGRSAGQSGEPGAAPESARRDGPAALAGAGLGDARDLARADGGNRSGGVAAVPRRYDGDALAADARHRFAGRSAPPERARPRGHDRGRGLVVAAPGDGGRRGLGDHRGAQRGLCAGEFDPCPVRHVRRPRRVGGDRRIAAPIARALCRGDRRDLPAYPGDGAGHRRPDGAGGHGQAAGRRRCGRSRDGGARQRLRSSCRPARAQRSGWPGRTTANRDRASQFRLRTDLAHASRRAWHAIPSQPGGDPRRSWLLRCDRGCDVARDRDAAWRRARAALPAARA